MITYNSACELAHLFPAEIGAFLDLEAGLHGGHFGEETVTDLFMAAFLKLPGHGAIVQKPDETVTGGDMDWFIYDKTKVCGYRIQSKRLSCTTRKWEYYSFRELAHPNNKGTQGKSLTNAANLKSPISMYPLYCFYSPNIAVKKSKGAFKAIMLADGFHIARVIDGIAKKKMTTRNDRRISTLAPAFFDLALILCPRTQGTATTPIAPGSGLATPVESTFRLISRDSQPDGSARRPEVNPRSGQIANIIAQAEERLNRGERLQEVKGLPRPRAFLRSA